MGRARPRSHTTRHKGASTLPGAPFLSERTLNRQLQSQAPCSLRPVVQQPQLPTACLRQRRASLVGGWSSPLCTPGPQSQPLQTNPWEAHTQHTWACVRGQPREDLVLQPTCRHWKPLNQEAERHGWFSPKRGTMPR